MMTPWLRVVLDLIQILVDGIAIGVTEL